MEASPPKEVKNLDIDKDYLKNLKEAQKTEAPLLAPEPAIPWPEVSHPLKPEFTNPQIAKKILPLVGGGPDSKLLMLMALSHTPVLTDGVVDPKKVEWLIKAKTGTTTKIVARLCFIGAILKDGNQMVVNNEVLKLVCRRALSNGLV